MSEKRKPEFIIVATIRGKRLRVEMFPRSLWEPVSKRETSYRLRVNGKWHEPGGRRYHQITEVLDGLRRKMVRVKNQPRHASPVVKNINDPTQEKNISPK